MASKYSVLSDWLIGAEQQTINISITELEQTIGLSFPAYVHEYRWANDRTQPLARSYMTVGYLVSQPEADKEVLCFRFNPDRARALLEGAKSKQNHTIHRQGHTTHRAERPDVPRPCTDEVEKYLKRWDDQKNYRLQECALEKLFYKVYPTNSEIEDILVKVSCLNDFYSTQIRYVFSVAKHIHSLNIDERLQQGDPTLVEEIAAVRVPNGKTINYFSFATKYCSHHHPTKYAIWDSYVVELLKYYRDVDGFAQFSNDELAHYVSFEHILESFAKFYGLEGYSLKNLDRYLWQLGKDKFPQKRYQSKKA